MKKLKYSLPILGLVLVVIILLNAISTIVTSKTGAVVPQKTESQDLANINTKNEIVYARLESDGSMDGIYVVNHFEITKAGLVTDYGDYAKVYNLTDTNQIDITSGVINFNASEGNYYYQGNTTSPDLPWIFDIEYRLDGTLMVPQEIGGQSGALEIHFSSRANANVDSTFYDNYMLQISVSLDTDKSSNIVAPNAIFASAGKERILSYTIMPGKDANFTIKADVDNFTMAGIEITGMPFSSPVELPDTDEMLDEMTLLPSAINILDKGVGELNTGVAELNNGIDELVNGSSNFAKGLSTLSENSGELVEGSEQIKTALSTLAITLNNFNSGDDVELDDLSQLPKGLQQVAQGLEELNLGLKHLKGGYAHMYTSLDLAIMAIPTITEEEITSISILMNGMDNSDPNKVILSQLLKAYGAGQTVLGTYTFNSPDTGVNIRDVMGEVTTTLDTMVEGINSIIMSLNSMADGIEQSMQNNSMLEQIQQLASGLTQLSDNYNIFHIGLVDYTNGVGRMSNAYNGLDDGIGNLQDGVVKLHEGTKELYEGTGELNDAIAGLPGTMQVEIDKLTEDYIGSNFTPISFISPNNSDTEFVQFVVMCDGIKLVETEEIVDVEIKTETFWDRLLALFK